MTDTPHLLVAGQARQPLTWVRTEGTLVLTFDVEVYAYLTVDLLWVDPDALERAPLRLHNTLTVWSAGHQGLMTLTFADR